MKDINISIVNYKMKDDIEKCLASLSNDIKNSALNVNIVLIDNDSNDDVGEFIRKKYPNMDFVAQSKNLGFGMSQNIGIKRHAAKYQFILNPDTIFPENANTIRKMYDFMEKNTKIGLIGPKIIYPDGSLQYSCYRFPVFFQPIFSRTKLGERGMGKKIKNKFLMMDFDHKQTIPVDWVMGSAMFARSAALEEVGLFDESFFMYAEDSDLCRRMWESGWPVYYVHDIVIKHSHGRGSAKVPGVVRALLKNKLARIHIKSWFRYMWKWKGNKKYYESKS
ncbi:MAG: glycosyltransferase [Candidatus Magasanikbacteria bacterium]|nr:glycosyltransferase [Candidatus Magasanikbacteria bacterium]